MLEGGCLCWRVSAKGAEATWCCYVFVLIEAVCHSTEEEKLIMHTHNFPLTEVNQFCAFILLFSFHIHSESIWSNRSGDSTL